MRIVVRENLSRDMIDILYQDIINAYHKLQEKGVNKKEEHKLRWKGHRIC